jgi:hypothetical protein
MAPRTTTDIPNERRFDRGSWLAVGSVLLFFLWTLPLAITQMRMPIDGCLLDMSNFDAPAVTTCFADWPTPLRSGDLIIQVAGTSTAIDIANAVPKPPPPGWVDGGIVRYTVLRNTQSIDLDVPLQSMDLGDVARCFGYRIWNESPIDLLILLVAIAIFLLRPRSRAAQLLLVASATSTLSQSLLWAGNTIGGAYSDTQPTVWVSESIPLYSAGWVSLPALLLLILSFPRPVWPITRWSRLAPVLIFGVGFGATLASLIIGNFGIFLIGLGLYALLIIVTFATVTVHTALRVRDPIVRAQAAWMGLGMAVYCSSTLMWATLNIVPGGSAWFSDNKLLLNVFGMISNLTLPLCLGIAITRYRLFDIEVIIRRTLVYSILTLTLALVYIGCIVLSRTLITPLVGGSEVAVVVSTLAIAALFLPLRRHIQNIIDKRFYRRKYDAAKVLAAFGATARDETDLERLTDELLGIVGETMQPEFVGLWLRDSPVRARSEVHRSPSNST